jgi:hypothetical protein
MTQYNRRPRMLIYDDIANYCQEDAPDLIYLSIGCAQNGNPVSNEQQVPPFIKAMPGRIVFILVDPALESPLQAFKDLGFPSTQIECPITIRGRFDVIALRQNFDWARNEEKSFIDALCALTLGTRTRLIVQDFSGENIHKHYPLKAFGPDLLNRAIFDVTHRDGGCHAPWVHGFPPQFTHPTTGHFVHPWNQPLTVVKPGISEDIYKQQKDTRISQLTNYIHRLYHIQAGTHEPRIWCTPELAGTYTDWLFDIYDITPGTDNDTLRTLLVAMYRDIVAAEGRPVPTVSEVVGLIDAPYGEYHKALASPGPDCRRG